MYIYIYVCVCVFPARVWNMFNYISGYKPLLSQVTARCHQAMMTSSNGKPFPRYWLFVKRILPVTGEFPSQRAVTRSCDVFFDLRLNKHLRNNGEAGDLGRHRAHYDVTVMATNFTGKKSHLAAKYIFHLTEIFHPYCKRRNCYIIRISDIGPLSAKGNFACWFRGTGILWQPLLFSGDIYFAWKYASTDIWDLY